MTATGILTKIPDRIRAVVARALWAAAATAAGYLTVENLGIPPAYAVPVGFVFSAIKSAIALKVGTTGGPTFSSTSIEAPTS